MPRKQDLRTQHLRYCATFQHSSINNHPKADISQFKIIDQDWKHVSREARKAIHIRRNNPTLNHNIDKMNIPKTFNQILGKTNSTGTDFSKNQMPTKSTFYFW